MLAGWSDIFPLFKKVKQLCKCPVTSNMRKIAHCTKCIREPAHVHILFKLLPTGTHLGDLNTVTWAALVFSSCTPALIILIDIEWHKEKLLPRQRLQRCHLLCCWLKNCSIQPLHSVKWYVAARTCLIAINWTKGITHDGTAYTQVHVHTCSAICHRALSEINRYLSFV